MNCLLKKSTLLNELKKFFNYVELLTILGKFQQAPRGSGNVPIQNVYDTKKSNMTKYLLIGGGVLATVLIIALVTKKGK